MEKVATFLAKTLGAFRLRQTLDKQERLKRKAEIHNFLRLEQGFDYKEEDLASEKRLWDLYERWMSHHEISRSLAEKQQRFGVFKANLEYIHKVNQMDKPYKLGLNQFSDITKDEFLQHYTGYIHDLRQETPVTYERTQNLRASVD